MEKVARSALERMYPKFEVADDNRWGRVLRQALNGDSNALEALDYRGNPEDHPVCAAVLKAVNSTTRRCANSSLRRPMDGRRTLWTPRWRF